MWFLGCVIPASWPCLAAQARFTQPGDLSLADPCSFYFPEFCSAILAGPHVAEVTHVPEQDQILNFRDHELATT